MHEARNSVINAATWAIETTIKVGNYPQVVAFSSDSSVAYVTSGGVAGNNGANTVSVINTASRKVTKVIGVAASPLGIAVN